MSKSLVSFRLISSLLAGCATPPQTAHPQASSEHSATATAVNTAHVDNDSDYVTMFVPPPTGSLLGGGSVRSEEGK